MSLQSSQNDKRQNVEQIIRELLPEEQGYERTVLEAMNYSMLAGGKRIRPMMMYETYRMYAERQDADRYPVQEFGESLVGPFLAAIEMIHTYSLVHDDLPAMDNDEYRRGRKTTHVVYGEAMAILAGDGLLTHAFQTAAKAFEAVDTARMRGSDSGDSGDALGGISDSDAAILYGRIGRALGVLAKKAGIDGMLAGQCVDVEAEKKNAAVSMEMLLYIHEKKTAAMIQSALMIGAILAGAPDQDIEKLERVGYLVGIAFQIRDDILDVEGSQTQLGKPIGSDARNQKTTYVTLAGMEQAKKDVESISQEAIDTMAQLTVHNEFLSELIRDMVYRTS